MKIHLIPKQKSHKVIQKVYPDKGIIFLIEEDIFHEEILESILNFVVRKRFMAVHGLSYQPLSCFLFIQ